jgi:hypothetical protein
MWSFIVGHLPTIIAAVIGLAGTLLKGRAAKQYKAGVEVMVGVVKKLDDKTVANAVNLATTKDGIKTLAGAGISAVVERLNANILKK